MTEAQLIEDIALWLFRKIGGAFDTENRMRTAREDAVMLISKVRCADGRTDRERIDGLVRSALNDRNLI